MAFLESLKSRVLSWLEGHRAEPVPVETGLRLVPPIKEMVQNQEEAKSSSDQPPQNRRMEEPELKRQLRACVGEIINQARQSSQQAFVIDQLLTSLEELSLMVQETAEDAEKVYDLASTSKKTAEEGGQSIHRFVGAIEDITRTQKGISKVTDEVSLLAKESRIISINSMVEAARAGEKGITFMVVAERIQSLSHEAMKAAEQINGFADATSSNVGKVREMADQALGSLDKIVSRSNEVAQFILQLHQVISAQSSTLVDLSKMVSTLKNKVTSSSLRLEKRGQELPALLNLDDFDDIFAAVGAAEEGIDELAKEVKLEPLGDDKQSEPKKSDEASTKKVSGESFEDF